MRTPKQGACCGLFLAANKEALNNKGEFFSCNSVDVCNELVNDQNILNSLWIDSMKIFEDQFKKY